VTRTIHVNEREHEIRASDDTPLLCVVVDRAPGHVRVAKLTIAHDCGLIVNPDGLRNQIEGNAIQATSRAIEEAVRFDASGVTSLDWHSYPIVRFSDVPDVTIGLIDRKHEPVLGVGEATTVVIAQLHVFHDCSAVARSLQ
jgi:CO/xanthine dehydrogenase Mo-binding subunit